MDGIIFTMIDDKKHQNGFRSCQERENMMSMSCSYLCFSQNKHVMMIYNLPFWFKVNFLYIFFFFFFHFVIRKSINHHILFTFPICKTFYISCITSIERMMLLYCYIYIYMRYIVYTSRVLRRWIIFIYFEQIDYVRCQLLAVDLKYILMICLFVVFKMF